jgi:AraC-like DNA-binding protein
VATLAARAGISPSHFFALFKRQIGCAPIDYFIHLRMQHACRLLDETTLNVKEVADALGYDDPFYFSRVFKAVNNVSPSQYRLSRTNDRESLENTGQSLILAKEALMPA